MGEVTDPAILAQLNGGTQVQRQPGGGMIITDTAAINREAREASKEQVTQAEKTFRTMTAEEAAAQGLPEGGVYQINGLGEIKTIQAAPKPSVVAGEVEAKDRENSMRALIAVGVDVLGGTDRVAELIMGSTSGGLQRRGAELYGAVTGEATEGMENIGRLSTIASDLTLAMTGGSLGSQISNSDRDFINQRMGNVGDPDVPASQRLAAWNEVKGRLARAIGVNTDEVFFATPEQLTRPQPTRSAGEGEPFLSERDMELQNALAEAYVNGATLEELQAIAAPYNQTLPIATQEELDAARAQGRGIVVTPTGREGGDADYQAKVTAAADSFEQQQGESGLAALAQQGMTLGLSDEAGGVGFALGQMLAGNFDVQDTYAFGRDVERELIRRARERTGGMGTAAELLGGGGAIRAAGAATTAGRAALEGAGAGGVGGFGYGEGTEGSLAGAALGAGAGAALGGGLQALANRGAARASTPRVERDAADIIATGQAEGVPVLTSDVRRPRTWFGNWLQGTGEKLPIVGTGGVRAAQQESRAAMIEKLADDYADNAATIDAVTADFMKTRGDAIGRYAKQKREVFSQLAGAPPPVTQNALDTLDLAIGRFGPQETYRGMVSRIQGWRNDLANARDIGDVESLRKAIGDTFQDEGMKSFSTELRNVVNGPDGLYAALKKDMANYIRDNAGDAAVAKWSSANAKLADFADDLGKTTLDRVLKRGEATPEEAASLLFSKKPSDVRALFKNLSPDGQKRARSLVIQKLVDDAGGIAELSTAKFRNAMARSADTFGVIFPKAEADRLAGVLRLLQATRRAEQASVTTPTGQSTLPFVGASGLGFLAGDWFGAAGVGTATALGFRGYESKAMRNLLVALGKVKEGSKAEQNILGNIGRVLARTAPAATAPAQARPEAQPTSTIEVR